MKTVQDMLAQCDVSQKAIYKRISHLGIKPVCKQHLTNYYSDEDYEKVIHYEKQDSISKSLRQYGVYRVSIEGVNANGKACYVMRHFGLTVKQAAKLIESYKKQGIRAKAYLCKF